MSDTPPPLPPAGWFRDPMGQGDARYWNGVAWTDSVSRGGVTFTAAVPPEHTRVPPVPGTEYHPPQAPPAAVAAAVPPPQKSGSGTSILIAIAVAAAALLVAVLIITVVFDGDDDDDPSTTTVPATSGTDAPAPPTDPPATDPPATDAATATTGG